MSSSVNEDQDQRNNGGLEELTTMTIESLRARLLSERAISKTSSQRIDELAKRVVELEGQLKLVSLQRKKAEKATAGVLAILESNGIGDVSVAFDSNSDQETIISDSKVSNDSVKRKETSSDFEVRRCDVEAYSSSEIDSSPSTGRSLSWKSSKDSLHSLERNKYTDTVRRRCSSFNSHGSLPKRVGKSCRRIRRRETRSMADGLCDDDNTHDSQGKTVDTCSQDSPNCADIKQLANDGVKNLAEAPVSGLSENRIADAYFPSRNGQDDDLKSVLQHQAQLKEQHEAEDSAQREWEEKVRENSSCALDSCDPGNRSDVTEERDDVRASGPSSPAGIINSLNPKNKLEVVKTGFTSEMELKVFNNLVIPPHSETGYLQDQKTSSLVAHGSSSSEFAFPTCKGTQRQIFSGNLYNMPYGSSHTYLVSNSSPGNPSIPFPCPNNGESSGSQREIAFMPQKSSSDLESVLKALQLAKLSLNQKLHDMQLLEVGSSGKGIETSVPGQNTEDRMKVPAGCPGLFRLPIDFHSEATTKVNYLGSNSALSLANCHPEPVPVKFLSCPYVEPKSRAFVDNQFFTSCSTSFTEIRSVHRPSPPLTHGASGIHTSAIPFTEIRPDISAIRPVFEPALDASLTSSNRSTYLDPQRNAALLLPSRYTCAAYPFYPEVPPQAPGNETFSRNVPSMEFGMPSPARFSFYDDHSRPDMYK